jgi:hypothetical protein
MFMLEIFVELVHHVIRKILALPLGAQFRHPPQLASGSKLTPTRSEVLADGLFNASTDTGRPSTFPFERALCKPAVTREALEPRVRRRAEWQRSGQQYR